LVQPRDCSVARTLEIVGGRFALLALREVMLGDRRFDEMVRRTGASRDTLATRLRTLVRAGILERRRYCDHPARYEYHLTDAGRDLYPVIVALMRWGDRYLAGDDGPPMALVHCCGHRLGAKLVCEDCGGAVEVDTSHPVRLETPYPIEACAGLLLTRPCPVTGPCPAGGRGRANLGSPGRCSASDRPRPRWRRGRRHPGAVAWWPAGRSQSRVR
jgi:DNA-binding HxlR family transcriptional regulator